MRREIAISFLCLLGFDVMGQLSFKAAALAALLFHEAIGWQQIVGAIAILAGILCLALKESGSEPGI